MPRVEDKTKERVHAAMVSIVQLYEKLDTEPLAEGHVTWLQTDIQSLSIAAEAMEIQIYG